MNQRLDEMLSSAVIDNLFSPVHTYLKLRSIEPPLHPSYSLTFRLSGFPRRLLLSIKLIASLLPSRFLLFFLFFVDHRCAKLSSASIPSKTHHHLSSRHWRRHCCHRSFLQKSSQQMVEPFALRHYRSFHHYRIKDIWREVHSC